MIESFSGDPFLAARAIREKLLEFTRAGHETVEAGEELDVSVLRAAAGQTGLFGTSVIFLDFDAAFSGQAGVKPRNAVMKALATVPADQPVLVLDSSATDARRKNWLKLGEHTHLPTPRFQALDRWIAAELKAAGVKHDRDVPAAFSELFGEDLPGIASEILKLSVLGTDLDAASVRRLSGRDSMTDSFAFIESITAGDAAAALQNLRLLRQQAEEAMRVLAAVSWQFGLVARTVAELAADPRQPDGQLARELRVAPFAAGKARRIAARLDEDRLLPLLRGVASAELAAKSGRNADWALEKLAIELSGFFSRS